MSVVVSDARSDGKRDRVGGNICSRGGIVVKGGEVDDGVFIAGDVLERPSGPVLLVALVPILEVLEALALLREVLLGSALGR